MFFWLDIVFIFLTFPHCVFSASPRQCIDLFFDEKYSIEPSWECKFDHIEVRDGPFSFSTLIGRYCGQESPLYIKSSGRYLHIKFVADGELEAIGFSARYNFTQGNIISNTSICFNRFNICSVILRLLLNVWLRQANCLSHPGTHGDTQTQYWHKVVHIQLMQRTSAKQFTSHSSVTELELQETGVVLTAVCVHISCCICSAGTHAATGEGGGGGFISSFTQLMKACLQGSTACQLWASA